MEIREYIDILWRRKWVVVLTLLATTLTVAIGTYFATPVYTASAVIRVAANPAIGYEYDDLLRSEQLRDTYAKMASTKPILYLAKILRGLPAAPEADQVEAELIRGTELIELQVEETDPLLAAEIANGLAEAIVTNHRLPLSDSAGGEEAILGEIGRVDQELRAAQAEYDELLAQGSSDTERIGALARTIQVKEGALSELIAQYGPVRVDLATSESPYIVSVFEPATAPTTPTQPRVLLNLASAVALGLVGGVALAFLFENLGISAPARRQPSQPRPRQAAPEPPPPAVTASVSEIPDRPLIREAVRPSPWSGDWARKRKAVYSLVGLESHQLQKRKAARQRSGGTPAGFYGRRVAGELPPPERTHQQMADDAWRDHLEGAASQLEAEFLRISQRNAKRS